MALTSLRPCHNVIHMMQHKQDIICAAPQHSLQHLQVTQHMIQEEWCCLLWWYAWCHHAGHMDNLEKPDRLKSEPCLCDSNVWLLMY